MRVLIVADTLTNRPANPFALQLIESLVALPQVRDVSYGVQLFFWKRATFDVIHFQWPEVLFDWRVPPPRLIDAFKRRVARHKELGAIVTTVHNLDPHPPLGDSGEMIFELVYSVSDAFTHLSEGAKELFIGKYGNKVWCRNASHHVVEHGDYAPHYTRIGEDHSLARSAKATDETRLLLVFGALRSLEEEALARRAFEEAGVPKTKLVFAGNPVTATLPAGSVAAWSARADANILRYHARIADEQVGPLIKASHFLFIPRVGRINSGVIPLAFTFGVPVIAPDEALSSAVQAVGGPTYRPGDVQAAAAAIRAAFAMDEVAYGQLRARINAYRLERMQWPMIGEQHARIYVQALRAHEGRRPIGRLKWFVRKIRDRISRKSA